jgi:putative transposase
MKHTPMRKIRFIFNHKGKMSDRELWKTLRISKSTFYREIKRYKDRKFYLVNKTNRVERPPGRRPVQIPHEHLTKIAEYRLKYKVGAVMLERLLKVKEGIHIPHNTINTVLRSAGMIKPVKKRGKKRKYVRWERKHSLSLWQADWSIFDGRWLIVFKDDASRLIVSWGVFDNATSENSVKVLKEGITKYGKPKAMLTGRDTQFYASNKKGKPSGMNYFQKFLNVNHIKHIKARVNHPQTCGKIERQFGEVKRRIFTYKDFDKIEDVVKWHNEVKPHLSLNVDKCETPIEAFERKMHYNRVVIKDFVEV